jgi:phosphotransferase system HPr (HPr) family protein
VSTSSEAVTRTVALTHDLHARPAGQVAQVAARHDATVELVAGDKRANARSVLAVMSLGAVAGTSVDILASGPASMAAADEIAGILAA